MLIRRIFKYISVSFDLDRQNKSQQEPNYKNTFHEYYPNSCWWGNCHVYVGVGAIAFLTCFSLAQLYETHQGVLALLLKPVLIVEWFNYIQLSISCLKKKIIHEKNCKSHLKMMLNPTPLGHSIHSEELSGVQAYCLLNNNSSIRSFSSR